MSKKHKAIRKVEKADRTISRKAAKVKDEPPVKALGLIGELGDQPPLIALCLATIAAGFWRGDDRLTRTGGRMLAAFALATGIKAIVKRSVDRTRPSLLVEHGRYEAGKGKRNEGPYNSFPSGHTAGAVAVARALGRGYPDQRPAAYSAAGVIAAVQIPRCNHFMSDIAAGAVIGWAAEAAVSALLDRLPARPAAIAA